MTLDPAYPQGGGGSAPIDLPDGSIPKVIGGELVASAMVEDSVEVLSGKTIEAPAASLKLGANLVMSNHGEIVQFSNSAYGDETLPVVAFHDDNGSETPVDYKLEPFEIRNSQPLDGDSFSGTELQFEATAPLFRGTVLTTPFGTLVLELTFRGDGVQTDGMRITMRINSFSGSILWQSANEVEFNAGVGITVNATGDTTVRLEAPFILRDGEDLFVTMDVLPENIISLKGNITTEFVPYLITKIQEVTRVPMASEEYADSVGGLQTVSTDATLTGDGTGGDPLSVVATSAPVDSVNGKIGVVVIDQTDVGLSNVDNTSDLSKPISTATQTALDAKAQSGDNVSIFANDAGYISSNAVDSVNTKTGVVVLDKTDIGLANVDNTSDADKPVSTAQALAFGQVDSVVQGTGVTVDATDPKNPIVSASGGGVTSKLYASDEDNGATTNLTLNDWIQVNVTPTVVNSTDFSHDGAGVFTYTGVDSKTFEFIAGVCQMGVGNDKTCEFAWFLNNVDQMLGKVDMDMSTSKFYGSTMPSAVKELINGDNMRICMRNTEDISNTIITNSWYKIKEW